MTNRVSKCYILPFAIGSNFSCIHCVAIYNKLYANFLTCTDACTLNMPVWLLCGSPLSNHGTGLILLFRKIGSSTIKPAPRNDPSMLPAPPMITMNRMRNDRSRLNPSGPTVPR